LKRGPGSNSGINMTAGRTFHLLSLACLVIAPVLIPFNGIIPKLIAGLLAAGGMAGFLSLRAGKRYSMFMGGGLGLLLFFLLTNLMIALRGNESGIHPAFTVVFLIFGVSGYISFLAAMKELAVFASCKTEENLWRLLLQFSAAIAGVALLFYTSTFFWDGSKFLRVLFTLLGFSMVILGLIFMYGLIRTVKVIGVIYSKRLNSSSQGEK